MHAFLHLVAGVTATHGTCHCGNLLAVAAAHLVAQQATHHGTDRGAGDLMLILHRALTGHGHVPAFLTRCLDGLGYRLYGQNLSVLGRAHHAIGRHSATSSDTDSTQHSTNQQ